MNDQLHKWLSLYFFSVCGAMILWTKVSLARKRALSFGDVFERAMPNNPKLRYMIQFAAFVLFGGMIGLVLAGPDTARQAIAGGIAWARMASSEEKAK